MSLSDTDIIRVRQRTRASSLAPWSDSISFARAVLEENRKSTRLEPQEIEAIFDILQNEIVRLMEQAYPDVERLMEQAQPPVPDEELKWNLRHREFIKTTMGKLRKALE